jgi:hypothetical protein
MISDWEGKLNDPSLRRVSFRQYQQESLSTEVARDR